MPRAGPAVTAAERALVAQALRQPRGRYVAERASQLSGIPSRTLHDWASSGTLTPDWGGARPRAWSYRDVVYARLLAWLRSKGMDRASAAARVAHLRTALAEPPPGAAGRPGLAGPPAGAAPPAGATVSALAGRPADGTPAPAPAAGGPTGAAGPASTAGPGAAGRPGGDDGGEGEAAGVGGDGHHSPRDDGNTPADSRRDTAPGAGADVHADSGERPGPAGAGRGVGARVDGGGHAGPGEGPATHADGGWRGAGPGDGTPRGQADGGRTGPGDGVTSDGDGGHAGPGDGPDAHADGSGNAGSAHADSGEGAGLAAGHEVHSDGHVLLVGDEALDRFSGQQAFAGVTGLLDAFSLTEPVEGVSRSGLWGPSLVRPSTHTRISPFTLGGEPCVVGSRVPTALLRALQVDRGLDVAAIGALYPFLPAAAIADALALEERLRAA